MYFCIARTKIPPSPIVQYMQHNDNAETGKERQKVYVNFLAEVRLFL